MNKPEIRSQIAAKQNSMNRMRQELAVTPQQSSRGKKVMAEYERTANELEHLKRLL